MAYKWSWAFGPETSTELNDLAGWQIANPAQFQPSQAIIHTYTGDATDRWAMQMDYANSGILAPLGVAGAQGWVGFYFYFNDPVNDFENKNLVAIEGPVSTLRSIAIRGEPGNNLQILIDGNTVGGFATVNLAKNTWHHIGVLYDMTIAGTWGAELFVNGVSVANGSRVSSNLKSESECNLRFNGLEDAGFYTMLSDIVTYDELTDPNPYGQITSRVQIDGDVAEVGTWSPASDPSVSPGAQATNLSGTIATSPVVGNATPSTFDYIQVSQSQTLATQLGISPTAFYGATSHQYASGASDLYLKAQIHEASSPGPSATSSYILIGENGYAYASTGSNPNGGDWAPGDRLLFTSLLSGS